MDVPEPPQRELQPHRVNAGVLDAPSEHTIGGLESPSHSVNEVGGRISTSMTMIPFTPSTLSSSSAAPHTQPATVPANPVWINYPDPQSLSTTTSVPTPYRWMAPMAGPYYLPGPYLPPTHSTIAEQSPVPAQQPPPIHVGTSNEAPWETASRYVRMRVNAAEQSRQPGPEAPRRPRHCRKCGKVQAECPGAHNSANCVNVPSESAET